LIIDPDRMLTLPVAGQRLQPVRGRRTQVAQILRLMQHVELAPRPLLHARKALYEFAPPEALRRAIAKGPDHANDYSVSRLTSNV
jgi:hypothetical protein